MTTLRRHLCWLVCGWLACQAAGVAAAPLLLWQIAVAHSDEECNCPLEPGAACPMHHTKGHDNTCKMRNAFGSSELALLSLAGGHSVLPAATVQVTPFDSGDPIGLPSAIAVSQAFTPDPPPPRLDPPFFG